MKSIFTHRNIARLSAVLFLALVLSSCEKFLDEKTIKTSALVVTTTDQLHALLNNYASFYQEANRAAIHSSDDDGLDITLYNARPATFSLTIIQSAFWDIDYLPDAADAFWTGEFGKIFRANMVLENLDRVTGPDRDKAILKADAHLVRAYSYWSLANTYCLPYTEATRQEVGLPIKTSTSFEQPFERQSLETVYNLIEADLAEALKTDVPLVQQGRARHWRASTAGVHGFAARYYLHRNNYSQALQHAEAALAEYGELVDYNTDMRYGRDLAVNINTGTPAAQTVTLKFPYTHDNQVDLTDMVGWKEFLYFRMLYHSSWWYLPSQELIDLYDQEHDLRFRYHYVQGYSYDRGMTNPAFNWPGYVFFFFKDRLPSGPTVAEMLLIKAEALARTNQVPQALAAVNQLRAKRLEPGAWVNLTAGNQAEAIRVVLEERRRELPFTQRWYDIRRFNNNEDPTDDVELSKTFYPYTISSVQSSEGPKTYTLPKNSRRFAVPLPRTELISSQDRIIQNTY